MAKGGAGKGSHGGSRHRVARKSATSAATGLSGKGKAARRNAAKQQRQHQRTMVLATQRAAAGAAGAPKVVSIVAAGATADTEQVAQLLFGRADVVSADGATCVLSAQRQRLTLLRPARQLDAVLDSMKAADVLMLVIPAEGGLDEEGERLVDAMCQQGVPSVVGVLQGVLPQKQQSAARKQWAASLEARFPENARLFSLDLDPDGAQIMRHLTTLTPRQLEWRKHHPYVLCHSYVTTPPTPEAAAGTLQLTGYVRGAALNVNRLIHVPGYGDCQVRAIEVPHEPHPVRRGGKEGAGAASAAEGGGGGGGGGMEVEEGAGAVVPGSVRATLLPTAEKQMDLKYVAEADDLMNEQTWPSLDELREAEAAARRRGGGDEGDEYAQGWLDGDGLRAGGEDDDDDDGDGEEDGEEEEEDGMDAERPAGSGAGGVGGEGKDDEDGDEGEGEGEAMEAGEIDMDAAALAASDAVQEQAARQRYLREREQRKLDAAFPDEVDTPLDQPARVRFARFRGLRSFRTSPWHPQENLPAEYANIYQFQDWPALQRHVLREQAAACDADEEMLEHAPPGAFVRIVLDAPAGFGAGAAGGVGGAGVTPLVVCGLNTYENKMTVLHLTIGLSAAAEAAEVSLRGKTPLIFRCGFRSFACRPIFSEDNRRGDKHKLERFLQPGRQCVATIYAPAMFAPSPMLAFLPAADPQAAALGATPVASGALLSADSDRIILKKVMLTGHPFKCHKSKAVVRWMFFDPEDIRWFKPVEISTKFGRKGHIKESLGTHGYMKVQFDKPIQQHDTVCMNLFKRSFPKWGAFSHALHQAEARREQ